MIQIESHEDEIFVSVDAAGVDRLIQSLTYVKNGGDHDHLMSPLWGGKDLTEGVRIRKDSTPINHLKIFFVSNSERPARLLSVPLFFLVCAAVDFGWGYIHSRSIAAAITAVILGAVGTAYFYFAMMSAR